MRQSESVTGWEPCAAEAGARGRVGAGTAQGPYSPQLGLWPPVWWGGQDESLGSKPVQGHPVLLTEEMFVL